MHDATRRRRAVLAACRSPLAAGSRSARRAELGRRPRPSALAPRRPPAAHGHGRPAARRPTRRTPVKVGERPERRSPRPRAAVCVGRSAPANARYWIDAATSARSAGRPGRRRRRAPTSRRRRRASGWPTRAARASTGSTPKTGARHGAPSACRCRPASVTPTAARSGSACSPTTAHDRRARADRPAASAGSPATVPIPRASPRSPPATARLGRPSRRTPAVSAVRSARIGGVTRRMPVGSEPAVRRRLRRAARCGSTLPQDGHSSHRIDPRTLRDGRIGVGRGPRADRRARPDGLRGQHDDHTVARHRRATSAAASASRSRVPAEPVRARSPATAASGSPARPRDRSRGSATRRCTDRGG